MLRTIWICAWLFSISAPLFAADDLSSADSALMRGDYSRATQILTTLADGGSAEAMVLLGSLYQRGEGVPRDAEKAVELYLSAAEQGHPTAQFHLGNMYLLGEGVPQDEDWALTFYRLAAEQGHVMARRNLDELRRGGLQEAAAASGQQPAEPESAAPAEDVATTIEPLAPPAADSEPTVEVEPVDDSAPQTVAGDEAVAALLIDDVESESTPDVAPSLATDEPVMEADYDARISPAIVIEHTDPVVPPGGISDAGYEVAAPENHVVLPGSVLAASTMPALAAEATPMDVGPAAEPVIADSAQTMAADAEETISASLHRDEALVDAPNTSIDGNDDPFADDMTLSAADVASSDEVIAEPPIVVAESNAESEAPELETMMPVDESTTPVSVVADSQSDEAAALRKAKEHGIEIAMIDDAPVESAPTAEQIRAEAVALQERMAGAKQALEREHYEEAINELKTLNDEGYAEAAFVLSALAASGEGMPQNNEQAFTFLERAASLGSPEAQFELAERYYHGDGVAPDDAMAITYYRDAARGGHDAARDRLEGIYREAGIPMPDLSRPSQTAPTSMIDEGGTLSPSPTTVTASPMQQPVAIEPEPVAVVEQANEAIVPEPIEYSNEDVTADATDESTDSFVVRDPRISPAIIVNHPAVLPRRADTDSDEPAPGALPSHEVVPGSAIAQRVAVISTQTDRSPLPEESEDELVTLHLEELTETETVTGLTAEELEAMPEDDVLTAEVSPDTEAPVSSDTWVNAVDESADAMVDTAVSADVAPLTSAAVAGAAVADGSVGWLGRIKSWFGGGSDEQDEPSPVTIANTDTPDVEDEPFVDPATAATNPEYAPPAALSDTADPSAALEPISVVIDSPPVTEDVPAVAAALEPQTLDPGYQDVFMETDGEMSPVTEAVAEVSPALEEVSEPEAVGSTGIESLSQPVVDAPDATQSNEVDPIAMLPSEGEDTTMQPTAEPQADELDVESAIRALADGRYAVAFDAFSKLAEAGNAEAQAHLGYMYFRGEGVDADLATAVEWYRRAAVQGDRDAQYNLAVAYAFGEGVEQDDEEAAIWYRRAAEQGSAIAQYSLGLSYALGEGVAQNDEQAVHWYLAAAQQGYAAAQYNLGYCYRTGQGTDVDEPEALRWFTEAAHNGHASAQYSLGYMYRSGRGVDRDLTEAMRWYRLAADQGHPEARADLASLNVDAL